MTGTQEKIYQALDYLRLRVQDGAYGKSEALTFDPQAFKDALQFHLLEDLEE